MFSTEDLQILGATVPTLVTVVTWHLEFVHPSCSQIFYASMKLLLGLIIFHVGVI
jgi:hypothetical protein